MPLIAVIHIHKILLEKMTGKLSLWENVLGDWLSY